MVRSSGACRFLLSEAGSQGRDYCGLNSSTRRHLVAAPIVGVRAVPPDDLLSWELFMSTYDSMCDRQPPINEVDRVVIALPADTTFYSNVHYVAVAFDASSEAVTPSILGSSRCLAFLPRHQIFSALCGDRSIRSVDHHLLVKGKPVTPEQYLGLWRTALKQPCSSDEFADRRGYALIAVLGGVLEKLRGVSSPRTSSPFPMFDDFEAAYSDKMVLLDEGCKFRLELDLRQENTARDAFYGEALLAQVDDRCDVSASLMLRQIEVPGNPGINVSVGQGDLFAATKETK
jgi:hypothetical protein